MMALYVRSKTDNRIYAFAAPGLIALHGDTWEPSTEQDYINQQIADNNWVQGIKPTRSTFREDLSAIINKHSKENGSDTPDFLLAEYLGGCLAAYDKAVSQRESWYGRPPAVEGVVDGIINTLPSKD